MCERLRNLWPSRNASNFNNESKTFCHEAIYIWSVANVRRPSGIFGKPSKFQTHALRFLLLFVPPQLPSCQEPRSNTLKLAGLSRLLWWWSSQNLAASARCISESPVELCTPFSKSHNTNTWVKVNDCDFDLAKLAADASLACQLGSMILLPATFKPCHLDLPDSTKMHGFHACSLVERQFQGSPSKSSWPCHNLQHSLVYRTTSLSLSIETHEVESIMLLWCSFFLPEIFPACSCYILTKAWEALHGLQYISTTKSLRKLYSTQSFLGPHNKQALVIRFATRSPYAIVHMILQLPGDLLLRLFGDSINGLTELQLRWVRPCVFLTKKTGMKAPPWHSLSWPNHQRTTRGEYIQTEAST